MSEFIVAEVTKNWLAGQPEYPLISDKFQQVIEVNLRRGYQLHSFQINQIILNETIMTETIIAVFQKMRELHA
ncbi:hypothetical protein KW791_00655 [Candidatus Parcubacteria bacterium]|nr:hypothetical protein [Candidatus Parcubacteria bacterium]